MTRLTTVLPRDAVRIAAVIAEEAEKFSSGAEEDEESGGGLLGLLR